MGAIIAFFLGPIGKWVALGIGVVVILGGTYTKGRFDGRASYKAQVEAAIAKAVAKGDAAKAKALKDFDASTELPDDGFARD